MTSKDISNFLDTIRDVRLSYQSHVDEKRKSEEETQDILHTLELRKNSAVELTRLMVKLRNVRRCRRYHKEQIEIMQPVYDWAKKNKPALDDLQKVLGDTRKIEKDFDGRIYFLRTSVVKDSIGIEDAFLKKEV